MNQHPAMRLHPSNSPFFRGSTPRSPTKANRAEEYGLRLTKVIGTTTTSPNGLDCCQTSRQFAYTAGAAAIVATISDDLSISQQFFKARPTLPGSTRETTPQWPISPGIADTRNKTLGYFKDAASTGSPLGASSRDWSDSPSSRSLTAKDRVKAATSVALSPNGKWLAIGETGYRPRILIFSLSDTESDTPVAAISEHSFGVHALRFSPDSRFLASLGTVNDGFLYVWAVDDRIGNLVLHASNKCTVLINDIAWLGQSLVTAGLRFVKVWRLVDDDAPPGEARRNDSALGPLTPRYRAENKSFDFGNSVLSPNNKVLGGKNSLLGDMLDANFRSVVIAGDSEAFLCTDGGQICLLNDTDKAQSMHLVRTAPFPIASARLDEPTGTLHIAGSKGECEILPLSDLRKTLPAASTESPQSSTTSSRQSIGQEAGIVAMCSMHDVDIRIDSRGAMRLTAVHRSDDGTTETPIEQIPGHDSAIACVKAVTLHDNATYFLTVSTNGQVRLWTRDGVCTKAHTLPGMSQLTPMGVTNEVKAASVFPLEQQLVVGDKSGIASVLDLESGSVSLQIRAHASEITDVCAFTRDGGHYVATCGRDRVVQLFVRTSTSLDLVQTLDDHAGAVSNVMASVDGAVLLSASADRNIVVRDAVMRSNDPASLAYVIRRTISLKSSPTSMCFAADADTILVATADRSIAQFNHRTGHAGTSFKCSDQEGGEAVIMTKIAVAVVANGAPTIVGISSTDKSIRLYTESGILIARDWGHTEGVTDLAVLNGQRTNADDDLASTKVVSVAADSTVFVWETGPMRKSSTRGDNADWSKELAPIAPPLRKVLSFSELSRTRRGSSIDNGEPVSPIAVLKGPASPRRLANKPSRMSLAQPPRLEPAIRNGLATPRRRRSLHQRSPSPGSPRGATNNDHARLDRAAPKTTRSQSTENVTTTSAVISTAATAAQHGFGSLTASTEAVSRTLRAYNKKLATASLSGGISLQAVRELEKDLDATMKLLKKRALSTRSPDQLADCRDPEQTAASNGIGEVHSSDAVSEDPKAENSADGPDLRIAGPDSGPVSTAASGHLGVSLEAVAGSLKEVKIKDEG